MVFRHPMTRVSRRRAQSYSSTSSASTSSTTNSIDAPSVAPQHSASRRRRNRSIGEALISPALLIMRSELFTPRTQTQSTTPSSPSHASASAPPAYAPAPSAAHVHEAESPIEMPAITITDEEGHEEVYHDDEVFEPFELECSPVPLVREKSPLRESTGRRRRGRSLDRGEVRERTPTPIGRGNIEISEREVVD